MGSVLTATLAITKPFLSKGANVLWENRDHLSLFLKTKFGKYKNLNIRFSMSGLFKIQIPETNKYLLVFNRRIENQLQPVGGVFKRYGDEKLFNKWGYCSDTSRNGLDVDEKSSKDLRFQVKGKHVVDVLLWFDEIDSDRESDPKREFKEELLDTGILSKETFDDIHCRRIRRYSKNLSWSNHFSCYEVLVYDVFELLPNDSQKLELLKLANEPVKESLSMGYAVVSCDDIYQLRFLQNGKQIARIGEHSKLLINQSF